MEAKALEKFVNDIRVFTIVADAGEGVGRRLP